jgi:hypothetical protein
MPSDDIYFIRFDLSIQLDGPFFCHNALTQLAGHCLNIARCQIQFRCNLFVRKVQTHEVQTQHPDPHRLMMSFKNGVTQNIELLPTRMTLIPLPLSLIRIITTFLDRARPTLRTGQFS